MSHQTIRLLVRVCQLSLLLIVAGCAVPTVPQQEQQFAALSRAEEDEIARQAYRQIVQQYGGVYPDDELALYLDGVGRSLASVSQRPDLGYRFQLLNDSELRAFSLPDGSVAVSRGLLVMLQSEAQLAAVLGSEIGHIVSRHHLQGLDAGSLRGQPVALVDELSPGSDYVALVNRLSRAGADLISKRFTPEQEAEADRTAVDLMVAAGYSPRAAVEVQELYLDHVQDVGSEDLGSLFYSHPFADERLVATSRYVETHPGIGGGTDGAVDFLLRIEPLRELQQGYDLYDQARQLERQQLTEEAIDAYHKALLEAPDEPLIMTGLGLAYLRSEDPVPARRYLIKATNLQGDYVQSRLGLGYVYLQKWQYAQAIGQLEKSLQLLPTVEAAFLLAEAQQQVGHNTAARDLYLIVASVAPEGKLGRLASERLQQLTGE